MHEKEKHKKSKARNEAAIAVKRLSRVNQKTYNNAIEQVMKRYRTLKSAHTREVNELVRELKGHWSHVTRALKKSAGKTAKRRSSKIKKARRR